MALHEMSLQSVCLSIMEVLSTGTIKSAVLISHYAVKILKNYKVLESHRYQRTGNLLSHVLGNILFN